MKLRIYIIPLLSAWFILLGLSSCHKKYDDSEVRDLIKANQEAIQKTQANIDSLKQVISAGAVITKVVAFTDSTGGIAIYLSNQKEPYKVYNGAKGNTGATGTAGKDAIVWTISDDGYWVKNDEKTGLRAKAADGTNGTNGTDGKPAADKGEKGDQGQNGENVQFYYVQNKDTGYFDIVYTDGTTPKEQSNILWTSQCLTATLVNGILTLNGVSGDQSSITLSSAQIASIALDMSTIEESYQGYPVVYFKKNWNNDGTLSNSQYYATVKLKVNPSNAILPSCTFSFSNVILEMIPNVLPPIPNENGILTLQVRVKENQTLSPFDLQLFTVTVKDGTGHSFTTDYATALPINGIESTLNQSSTVAWAQL